MTTQRGKGGGTYAHWQLGLAYAKYLSPEFHICCNTVVRERMEGKPAATQLVLDEQMKNAIGGIVKSVVHKEVIEAVQAMVAAQVHPTFDLSGTVTSDTIIEMTGVNRKERVRGTTVMITNALLDFCGGAGCFRTPADLNPARPWRFPREKARDWLFGTDHGAERIRNQIGAQMRKKDKKGQRLLNLVPPQSHPPAG